MRKCPRRIAHCINPSLGKRAIAFTVSSTQLGAVSDYITRQEEPHRPQAFPDEYREFLKLASVKYDELFFGSDALPLPGRTRVGGKPVACARLICEGPPAHACANTEVSSERLWG